jgi:glycerol transport system ATP-binding protein
MGFSISNVDKIVGHEVHLQDISLDLRSGTQNIILGRTLAGKTSLLRIMAGLDRPTKGVIRENDVDVTGVSVRKRSVAMVYQQFVNYPSLTVYDNIASALRISRMSKADVDARVMEAAKMLHLEPMLTRLPQELSGGQQQRTAIARALVKDAALLLLDEPLVNLDYKLREELRAELQEIFRQRESIVLYTTTEPSEALMLGGNIVIMHEGRVLQTGPTEEVYRRPSMIQVADIFSDPPINKIKAVVDGTHARLGENLSTPLDGHLTGLTPGEYLFGVRPHHLNMSRLHERDLELTCTVELSEISGSETFIHVDYGGLRLVVQERGVHRYPLGSRIPVFVRPRKIYIFDKGGELMRAPNLQES